MSRPMELTKFSLLKRRQDISHAQFLAHWQTVHVHVLIHQGRHRHYNRRYLQNDFQGLGSEDDLVFDGAAQMVPQSSQFVHNGFQQDPLYAQFVRPDEALFLAPDQCVVLYCHSEAWGHFPAVAHPRKLLCLVRRSAAQTADEFFTAWQARARHILTAWAGLQGIRHHRVLPGAATNMGNGQGQGHPVDLVEELFFESDAVLDAVFRSPQFQDSFQPHGAMPPGQGSHAFLAQERLIYEDA